MWAQVGMVKGDDKCLCTDTSIFVNPLVEIVQYAGWIEGNQAGIVNRGVRILENIQKGNCLGEYLGRFIPKGAHARFHDDVYPFHHYAPPESTSRGKLKRSTGDANETELSEPKAIATVIAGREGNWTRFINPARQGKENNCQFQLMFLWGRVRTVLVSLRDVELGEELNAAYGASYNEGRRFAGVEEEADRLDLSARSFSGDNNTQL